MEDRRTQRFERVHVIGGRKSGVVHHKAATLRGCVGLSALSRRLVFTGRFFWAAEVVLEPPAPGLRELVWPLGPPALDRAAAQVSHRRVNGDLDRVAAREAEIGDWHHGHVSDRGLLVRRLVGEFPRCRMAHEQRGVVRRRVDLRFEDPPLSRGVDRDLQAGFVLEDRRRAHVVVFSGDHLVGRRGTLRCVSRRLLRQSGGRQLIKARLHADLAVRDLVVRCRLCGPTALTRKREAEPRRKEASRRGRAQHELTVIGEPRIRCTPVPEDSATRAQLTQVCADPCPSTMPEPVERAPQHHDAVLDAKLGDPSSVVVLGPSRSEPAVGRVYW